MIKIKWGSYIFAISKLPLTSTVSLIVFTSPSTFHLPQFRFDNRGADVPHRSLSCDACNPPLIGFHFVITLIFKRDDLMTIEGLYGQMKYQQEKAI